MADLAPGTVVFSVSTGKAKGWEQNKVYRGTIISPSDRHSTLIDFDGVQMALPTNLLNRDYNISVNGKTITVNQSILKLIYETQEKNNSRTRQELGNDIEITAAANQMMLLGNVDPTEFFEEDEYEDDAQVAQMLTHMKKSGGRSRRKSRRKSRRRSSRR
jgi:hypothetical protein